jgi:hypothetical protein
MSRAPRAPARPAFAWLPTGAPRNLRQRCSTVLKPWNAEDLWLRLRKAAGAHLHRRRLARAALERDALRAECVDRGAFADVIGLTGGLKPIAAVLSTASS